MAPSKGTRPRAVVYAKGDEVKAKWKGNSVNYPATVTRVYANAEFYDLHYYFDNDRDVKLAAKFVSAVCTWSMSPACLLPPPPRRPRPPGPARPPKSQ